MDRSNSDPTRKKNDNIIVEGSNGSPSIKLHKTPNVESFPDGADNVISGIVSAQQNKDKEYPKSHPQVIQGNSSSSTSRPYNTTVEGSPKISETNFNPSDRYNVNKLSKTSHASSAKHSKISTHSNLTMPFLSSPINNPATSQFGYENYSTRDLTHLAAMRGIDTKPISSMIKNDADLKKMLITMLESYDKGNSAMSKSRFTRARGDSIFKHEDEASARPLSTSSPAHVLRQLRNMNGFMGVDIGGTLAKLVLLLPDEETEKSMLPKVFGRTGKCCEELEAVIDVVLEEDVASPVVMSGFSSNNVSPGLDSPAVNRTSGNLLISPNKKNLNGTNSLNSTGHARSSSLGSNNGATAHRFKFKFIQGSTAGMEKVVHSLAELKPFHDKEPRVITAAGGGAHKFQDLFLNCVNIKFEIYKEMQSVVEGLRFVLDRCDAFKDEILIIDENDEEKPCYDFVNEDSSSLFSASGSERFEEKTFDDLSKKIKNKLDRDANVQSSKSRSESNSDNEDTTATSPNKMNVHTKDTNLNVTQKTSQSSSSIPPSPDTKKQSNNENSMQQKVPNADSKKSAAEFPRRLSDEKTEPRPKTVAEQDFLLVNVGTGVSILHVSRSEFVRVGGTAVGGGTFLGLTRLMCGAQQFDDALHLASQGNATTIDTLVEDIYGKEGSVHLGLPGHLTASNFGKLGTIHPNDINGSKKPTAHDLARACLQLVVQQVSVLALAYSKMLNIEHIFFVGGFLEKNQIAKQAFAKSMRSLGRQAYFVRHSDFLGALGSLAHSLGKEGWDLNKRPSAEGVFSRENSMQNMAGNNNSNMNSPGSVKRRDHSDEDKMRQTENTNATTSRPNLIGRETDYHDR